MSETNCKPDYKKISFVLWWINSKLGVYNRQMKKRARKKHQELMPIFNSAHFIQLKIRINGEWEEYEGDYIKYL